MSELSQTKQKTTNYNGVNITDLTDEDTTTRFTISGVDVSIANGLRRIILSDIKSVVFRAFPHSESRITVKSNTSRINNEIIKQRISCVPIHITDVDFPIDDHLVELTVHNTGDGIIFATSKDFKIKNLKTDSYLMDDAVRSIFPPDPISGDWIDLVRLRPNTHGHHKGEEIVLTAELDWGSQSDDGAYNAVSTCTYTNTIDPIEANKQWIIREKELKANMTSDGMETSKQQLYMAKQDWNNLDAHRSFKNRSFDFSIESTGVWNNHYIVKLGCEAMIVRIRRFAAAIQTQRSVLIQPSNTTIRNAFDITMHDEDYTLGKVIEHYLYNDYYLMDGVAASKARPILTFCGFSKPHPHINESLIRLALTNTPDDINEIVNLVISASNRAIDVYSNILQYFGTSRATA